MKKLLLTMFAITAMVLPSMAYTYEPGILDGESEINSLSLSSIENARTKSLSDFFEGLSDSMDVYITSLITINSDWVKAIKAAGWTNEADMSKQKIFEEVLSKMIATDEQVKAKNGINITNTLANISDKFSQNIKNYELDEQIDTADIQNLCDKYEAMISGIEAISKDFKDLAQRFKLLNDFCYKNPYTGEYEDSKIFYEINADLCGNIHKVLDNNVNLLKRNLFVLKKVTEHDEHLANNIDRVKDTVDGVWRTFTRSVRFIRLGVNTLNSQLKRYTKTVDSKNNNLNRDAFCKILIKTTEICDELNGAFTSVAETK